MIRLKDIALRLGVSAMTVSKALRDEPDVSVATKTKVKKLAAQLGYVPNAAARSLRAKSTCMFGLVIPSLINPIFARVVMALEERAHEMGWEIIIAQSLNRADREENCIRRLLSRRVNGIFLSPVYRIEAHAPIYEELRRQQTPVVILGHRALFCERFSNVETDDIAASRATTQHLLSLGHRKIACFIGPPFAPWAQERFEGYRQAMSEAGIPLDDQLIFQAGSTIEEGQAAALEMINESTPATAIQATNDLVAIGAANTFLAQGVQIPRDLSIAGFGNILTSEHYRIPLTTVRQPKYRQGIAAMETMQNLLDGKPNELKRLPSELIIRQSTGPVPRS